MKPAYILAMALMPLAETAFPDDLGFGDTLYRRTSEGDSVETHEFRIEIGAEPATSDHSYQIRLYSKDDERQATYNFVQDSDGPPALDELNHAHYCGINSVFITTRYGIPRLADIRQYFFETHAFRNDTLEFIATAPVAFEEIAPLEDGVDLGFPYEMPQRFGVRCATDPEKPAFVFYQRGP